MKNVIRSLQNIFLPFVVCSGFVLLSTQCNNEKPKETTPQPAARALTGKFFTLSDVHFNPFYDPSILRQLANTDVEGWETIFRSSKVSGYGKYGEDSNFPLMTSAFAAMHSADANPDFIIITGDFLGHKFQKLYDSLVGSDSPNSFITKTTEFIAMQLAKQFPGVPFYPVLGNNDDFCGDYMIQPNDPFLPVFTNAWAPYRDSTSGTNTFLQTFPSQGCYAASLPNAPNHLIVGLNTMFFSPKDTSICMTPDTNAGHTEMAWLEQTLDSCAAHGQKVWFTCHIPPGAEVRSALKKNGCDVKMMWQEEYNNTFMNLESSYKNVINGGIGGHTHMDEFRMILDQSSAPLSFFHINPSISPIDGNNSAFQLFTYDTASMTMLDYTSYVFQGLQTASNANWVKQYDFNNTYGVSQITGQTMGTVCQNLSTDTAMSNKYIRFFGGGIDGATPSVWTPYLCCLSYTTYSGFSSCTCNSQ